MRVLVNHAVASVLCSIVDRRSRAAPAALPALRSTKILDQLRERIRLLHYSRRTEEAYVHWCRAFIRFRGIRHPRAASASRSTRWPRPTRSTVQKELVAASPGLYTVLRPYSIAAELRDGRLQASRLVGRTCAAT